MKDHNRTLHEQDPGRKVQPFVGYVDPHLPDFFDVTQISQDPWGSSVPALVIPLEELAECLEAELADGSVSLCSALRNALATARAFQAEALGVAA